MFISVNVLIILATFYEYATSASNITTISNLSKQYDETFKVLSRRKRFLIFPDGSSFQIVFCTQNHGYLQIGNIVWFGSTAALAWELPTDPGAFDMFRDRYKVFEGKRRSDVLYYLDEDGKIVDKVEYTRKVLINPAFAKRSVDAADNKNTINVNKREMHNMHKNMNLLKDLDIARLESHREERQKLYVKLERFMQSLGWKGKECILRMLCETGKATTEQQSFVGEILRAVFTLPKVRNSVSKVHKQYDDAHGANGDCAELYSKCGHISTV